MASITALNCPACAAPLTLTQEQQTWFSRIDGGGVIAVSGPQNRCVTCKHCEVTSLIEPGDSYAVPATTAVLQGCGIIVQATGPRSVAAAFVAPGAVINTGTGEIVEPETSGYTAPPLGTKVTCNDCEATFLLPVTGFGKCLNAPKLVSWRGTEPFTTPCCHRKVRRKTDGAIFRIASSEMRDG